MKLSTWFTLEEMSVSQTAARFGLDNTPPPEIAANLKLVCVNLLDPIRELAGHPVVVSSGYRSPAVNKKVGGAKKSQHLTGFAADITCPHLGQRAFFHLIRKSGLIFDQLIDEFAQWSHVSYSTASPRGQVLVARHVGGKTVYTPFTE